MFWGWQPSPAASRLAAPAARGGLAAVALSALAAFGVAAAAALAVGRAPLNLYDVSFSLDWGRELIHGQLPDVRVWGASTPHPLAIVSGAFAALFGGEALDAMRAVVFVAAGSVAVALVSLGRAFRSTWVGVAAALALVASEPFVLATLGQATVSDLPSLAAVLGALALEVARPRRGTAPLALLSFAGLFRPEAWLLAIAYAIYVGRSRDRASRVHLAILSLSAPVLWMASDLVLTGNPLYSLLFTRTATVAAQRPTGFMNVPDALRSTLTGYFNTPILVGAGLGLLLDLRLRRMPRLIPLSLALTILAFAAIGAAHLPLNDRYALPTTVLAAVYFGFFVAGWRTLPGGRLRWAWMLAALALTGPALAAVPSNVNALTLDRQSLGAQSRVAASLAALVRPAATRSLLARCGPVQVSYRIVPLLAYDLGRSPGTLTANDSGVPVSGTVIEPAPGLAAQMFETHVHPLASLTKRGFRLAASNGDWYVYTLCR